MDGSLEAWKHAQGIPSGFKPLSGLSVTLPNGRRFCLRSYISQMEAGSCWLADHLPAMRAMTVQWLRATGDEKRLRHPERTLASYVFQARARRDSPRHQDSMGEPRWSHSPQPPTRWYHYRTQPGGHQEHGSDRNVCVVQSGTGFPFDRHSPIIN